MNLLKNLFIIFWRLWFYAWMLGTIAFILPFLLIVISNEQWYPTFFKIARAWGKTILFIMGFKVQIDQDDAFDSDKSFVYCPNHTSMIDIMLMLSIIKKPFVFIGKKELSKIPVFGHIYKKTCILVDRDDKNSRLAVYEAAQQKMKRNYSICIFPEGKVPDDETIALDTFQNGAFRLAIEHQIPILPISFFDSKRYFSYTFFSGSPGTLRVKVHPPIVTKNLELKDKNRLKLKTREILLNSLKSDALYTQSCYPKN